MKACYHGFPLVKMKIKTTWITTFFRKKYAKYYLNSIFYVARCIPQSVQEAKYWSLLTYSSTSSFGLPIPVSDWLIFCSENLILHQKTKTKNENDETQVLWWKTRKKCQKVDTKNKVFSVFILNLLYWPML